MKKKFKEKTINKNFTQYLNWWKKSLKNAFYEEIIFKENTNLYL